jgi:hypothetical protein
MTKICKAGTRYKANIARANHRDFHLVTPFIRIGRTQFLCIKIQLLLQLSYAHIATANCRTSLPLGIGLAIGAVPKRKYHQTIPEWPARCTQTPPASHLDEVAEEE